MSQPRVQAIVRLYIADGKRFVPPVGLDGRGQHLNTQRRLDRLLAHVDDTYNRLAKNIGNDFTAGAAGITELYSFHCANCGYKNIHNIKQMTCGCGRSLEGTLVYRKVGDTVIYDMRGRSRGGKARG